MNFLNGTKGIVRCIYWVRKLLIVNSRPGIRKFIGYRIPSYRVRIIGLQVTAFRVIGFTVTEFRVIGLKVIELYSQDQNYKVQVMKFKAFGFKVIDVTAAEYAVTETRFGRFKGKERSVAKCNFANYKMLLHILKKITLYPNSTNIVSITINKPLNCDINKIILVTPQTPLKNQKPSQFSSIPNKKKKKKVLRKQAKENSKNSKEKNGGNRLISLVRLNK